MDTSGNTGIVDGPEKNNIPVPSSSQNIQVGTRDSELAVKQTHFIIDLLKSKYPKMTFTIESMKTLGDKILDVSLSKIGSKALFTKELELALEENHVSLVVHSLKDLPTTLPDGLVIGAVCNRENPSDAVILHPKHKDKSLSSLPAGSVIGTSSLRRVAQLKRKFPHLTFESIRGNLNTRLRKLEEDNKYDAIVLAAAGVIRMGWQEKISEYLKEKVCMYAVGQGALAVECRQDDTNTLDMLSPLNDLETLICVVAERSFMRHLEGGCSVPLAVNSQVKAGELLLTGGVWSLDGSEELVDSLSCSLEVQENDKNEDKEILPPSAKAMKKSPVDLCGIVGPRCSTARLNLAYNLGEQLATKLLERGAERILDEAKAESPAILNTIPVKAANGSMDKNSKESKDDSLGKTESKEANLVKN